MPMFFKKTRVLLLNLSVNTVSHYSEIVQIDAGLTDEMIDNLVERRFNFIHESDFTVDESSRIRGVCAWSDDIPSNRQPSKTLYQDGSSEDLNLLENFIKAELIIKTENRNCLFNVSPWFRQASDDEIVTLAQDNWESSSLSMDIANFMASADTRIESLLIYANSNSESNSPVNVTCTINKWFALAWLHLNKPELALRVESLEQFDGV